MSGVDAAQEQRPSRGQSEKPLCIDLDGTLVDTDTLVKNFVGALRRDPCVIFRLPIWLKRGRAALKMELARHTQIDAAGLPYNAALLAILKEQKATGRRIVLATAADQAIAQSVSGYIGLFDEVIASDGRLNLKGKAKAQALIERYGRKGFAYAGNSVADFAVWDHADTAIVVNASAKVVRGARDRCSVVTIIERRKP